MHVMGDTRAWGHREGLSKGPVEWGNTSGIDGPWVTVTVVQSWKGRGRFQGKSSEAKKCPIAQW